MSLGKRGKVRRELKLIHRGQASVVRYSSRSTNSRIVISIVWSHVMYSGELKAAMKK